MSISYVCESSALVLSLLCVYACCGWTAARVQYVQLWPQHNPDHFHVVLKIWQQCARHLTVVVPSEFSHRSWWLWITIEVLELYYIIMSFPFYVSTQHLAELVPCSYRYSIVTIFILKRDNILISIGSKCFEKWIPHPYIYTHFDICMCHHRECQSMRLFHIHACEIKTFWPDKNLILISKPCPFQLKVWLWGKM